MGVLTQHLSHMRLNDPEAFSRALRERDPGPQLGSPGGDERIMMIACDHPARGAVSAGGRDNAMINREDLLNRCITALQRPHVNGFLGTADMIEDLAVLGALEGKIVFGSMNRGGLHGAHFEMDDRFTGYDVEGIVDHHLDGGKMLMRIDYDDPASVDTLESCARAVDSLARAHRVAMIEPFISRRENGRVINDLTDQAVQKSMAIASGLGSSSRYSWLKLPAVHHIADVAESSTLPILILGGAGNDDLASRQLWARALQQPQVKGLVIGRSLLYPPNDDIISAVDSTVGLFQ
ncbi:Cgl0159 family (beta/alpha)8-fold protein [Actinomyces vulturis]|uniref:Cgl0159 family (beta/alpha)8-fold protein n=1 Tax=Actinomyces vulturis TaxID=1857645 RepID=UPI00083325CC|nr:deoxyribose-phosphate aldolase [Actinomyces vulturis]